MNDSVEISLLFDTGAQTPIFDSAFTDLNKDKLGITFKKTNSRTITPGGVIKINREIIGKINIKALGINKEFKGRFDVGNLLKTKLHTNAIFPAYWFFENNIVLMDFEHQFFRILSQDTLNNIKKHYTSFPLKGNPVTYFTVSTVVEISTNSKIKLNGELVLDIGAPGFLYLQVGKSPMRGKGPVVPVVLPEELMVFKTRTLTMNPKDTLQREIINANRITMLDSFSFQNEQVYLLDFRIAPEQIGFLGNEFFQKFQVIFDYKNKVFFLKPNQEYSKPHGPFSLGMKLYRSSDAKSLYVNSLYESSPVANSGIRLGDKILTINGKPTEEITFNELRALEYSNPSTKVILQVQRGQEFLSYEVLIDSLISSK
ncbi:MAG: PDZ domain-containing protein [Bacteroidales bacterium]|nr:PDZ domain-containing protein [Bacteroidales bacterium]